MPKKSKYPRLQTHIRRGKGGQVWVYYFFDMRSDGQKNIPLGTDHEEALRKWAELTETGALKVGRLEEAFQKWETEELPKYESQETRSGYAKNLRRLRPVFGQMVWDEIDLPTLRQYLDLRSAKTQGNREMSLLSLIWGKARLWGMTKCMWPAAGVKDWKNEEKARDFEVTKDLFEAVYRQGDQVLRDCMDISSATGLRLTDARTVRMPVNGVLRVKSSKTGKRAEFVVSESPVLTDIVARRAQIESDCGMLLVASRGARGRAVTASMLRDRWDAAREAAALRAEAARDQEMADTIRRMYLRDMRSFASDLAEDIEEASKLLQHSSKRVTEQHYRNRPERLKAVR